MLTAEQMKKCHDSLCDALYKKCSKFKRTQVILENNKCHKTLTFKSYECFLRFYFGDMLDISIRFNTLNCDDNKSWTYADANSSVTDFGEYRTVTYKYLTSMSYLWSNIVYCPEWHTEMIPHNYNDIIKLIGETHWCNVYEKLMEYECSFSDLECLNEWLSITTDNVFAKNIKRLE